MTRRVPILACLLAIALVLLGLQSWSIALDRIERHVIAGIESRVGLSLTGVERAEIALLPLPRISLSNVAFRQRDGMITGKALRLRARARLLSLFSGTLDFDRIELIGPEIDVALDAAPDTLGEWLKTSFAGLSGLRSQSRLIIANGAVFARDKGAISSIVRDVNLVLEEREATDPLLASGTLTWRGVATSVNLLWPMPGERARVSLAVVSDLLTLRLDGIRSGMTEPVINGRLSMTTRALPELFGWFGARPRLVGAIGPFSLQAEAQIKPHDISLSNASASLNGDKLDGALKLSETGARWSLAGTLAGASLDLGRLVSRLGVPTAEPGAGKATALEFDDWTAHDIDLRVSVDAARLNGARLGDVATYLLVKKGRFEAGLLRAGAYGGSAKGRLLAVSAPGGVDVRLQAGLDRVNLGQAGADLPEVARLSGTASLQIALDGIGNTSEEVLAAVNGKVGLALRQGEIIGFSALDLLRRAERNPALALREWRQGKTAFDNAGLNASVAGGLATVTDAHMTGPVYRIALAGQVSLPDRWIELSGALTALTGTLKIPLVLRGPLDDPALSPDAEAVLRHSGVPSPAPAVPTR